MSKSRSSKNKAADAAPTGTKVMNDQNQENQESQSAPVVQIEVKDEQLQSTEGTAEQSESASESQGTEEGAVDTAASEESSDAPNESTDAAQSEPAAEVILDQAEGAPEAVIGEAEVSAVETPVPTPAAEEQAPVVTPAAVVPEENVPQFLYVQRIRLADYVETMGGKLRVTDKQQLDQQNLFRMVIQNLLKLRGKDFVIALDDILATIQANKHYVFKEKYVFRQYPNLPIAADERRLLVDVVMLLLHISDPSTRALVIRQIDLSNALKGVRDFDEVHGLFHEYITSPSR